jgi:GT2 family glycosyltransferase
LLGQPFGHLARKGLFKMIDLVIVNYNSSELLNDCLASIKSSCNGAKPNVVVTDNGSRDPIEYIRKTYSDITIVRNKENIGYSRAINATLSTTDAPYVILLNPDTIVLTDHFLESIAAFMDLHPDVGILGPGVLDPDGRIQGSARSFPRFHSLFFGRRSLLTKIFPQSRLASANILTKNANNTEPLEVDWVSGACMVIRRHALQQVGMMDERFFMYWEDVDWCKRMWHMGWKVMYWPGVKIMHHVGGSSESRVVRSVLEFHKSALLYFNKHVKKYRSLILPPIYAAISLRFFGILFLQLVTRTFSYFIKKPDTVEETAQTWLYRSCSKNEFANDSYKELLRSKFENGNPDSVAPTARPGSHQLPN